MHTHRQRLWRRGFATSTNLESPLNEPEPEQGDLPQQPSDVSAASITFRVAAQTESKSCGSGYIFKDRRRYLKHHEVSNCSFSATTGQVWWCSMRIILKLEHICRLCLEQTITETYCVKKESVKFKRWHVRWMPLTETPPLSPLRSKTSTFQTAGAGWTHIINLNYIRKYPNACSSRRRLLVPCVCACMQCVCEPRLTPALFSTIFTYLGLFLPGLLVFLQPKIHLWMYMQ